MGLLKTQLKSDLTTAMKERDETAKATIRMALAALMNAEVAGAQARELTDEEEIRILSAQIRSREETAHTYADAGRPELAAKEAAEAEFLRRYVPAPLTDEELTGLVDREVARVTADLGAQPTMRQMGSIVKAVTAAAEGRADGATVAALVKARLSV